tara:strand:- start:266 stop:601 length:336 start_codon:yes stop_codon:yes gene_type:complete
MDGTYNQLDEIMLLEISDFLRSQYKKFTGKESFISVNWSLVEYELLPAWLHTIHDIDSLFMSVLAAIDLYPDYATHITDNLFLMFDRSELHTPKLFDRLVKALEEIENERS